MVLDKELIDKLLGEYKGPEDITGENGLLKQLTKALVERALAAELTTHLGYEKHAVEGRHSGNSRNGASSKRLKGEFGTVEIAVPRDRAGSFEPQLVPKGTTRFAGFDEKILSLYARGMTTREIQGHLEEMYQVEVSPTLISNVTEAVIEEVKAWQSRLLEPVYPIVYLDALVVKMRSEGRVENRAVYVAIGITMEGQKEVLGLWTSANEGAKFWLQVLTELKNRGVEDVFIACVDGLKGFPQAIETVYPKTTVQLCIVHMVRASLNYVNWKERKQVAAELKSIYRAATAEEAERQLEMFAARWDPKYPTISAMWRRNWLGIIPFFQFPAEIRKIVYTTNAVESLNMSLRKAIKTRGAFPSEDAALKVMYLALKNLAAKWHTIQGWKEALQRFAFLWEARFPQKCG
ncbi:IS256 family transposase [Terracidiphilus sp.]|jgi:putative transposase|uniref:IS256 family transposase n=1 Tax=Terracidiphilus sp. TaxID=1964191 RepID=UPI003C1FE837